jgi:hypothetical protein
MTNDPDAPADDQAAAMMELRQRAELLERQLLDLHKQTEARLLHSELKADAIRAGMIDLDGIKLIDTNGLRINERGEVDGGSSLMNELKKSKPWLFSVSSPSSSSASHVPQAQVPRQKAVLEMTDAEYRAAKAALVKR